MLSKRRFWAFAAIALALGAASAPAETLTVTVDKMAFSPAEINAKVGDTIEWDTTKLINGENGYRLYAQKAEEFGLTSLGPSIGDWAHIQLRKEEVTDLYTWKEINDRMKERFG